MFIFDLLNLVRNYLSFFWGILIQWVLWWTFLTVFLFLRLIFVNIYRLLIVNLLLIWINFRCLIIDAAFIHIFRFFAKITFFNSFVIWVTTNLVVEIVFFVLLNIIIWSILIFLLSIFIGVFRRIIVLPFIFRVLNRVIVLNNIIAIRVIILNIIIVRVSRIILLYISFRIFTLIRFFIHFIIIILINISRLNI